MLIISYIEIYTCVRELAASRAGLTCTYRMACRWCLVNLTTTLSSRVRRQTHVRATDTGPFSFIRMLLIPNAGEARRRARPRLQSQQGCSTRRRSAQIGAHRQPRGGVKGIRPRIPAASLHTTPRPRASTQRRLPAIALHVSGVLLLSNTLKAAARRALARAMWYRSCSSSHTAPHPHPASAQDRECKRAVVVGVVAHCAQ